MSRTKLMKPGSTRSVNCRGGGRRAKTNSSKNVKSPEKGVKRKAPSRYRVSPRVDPAQLNPEKMPPIELVDFKNYGWVRYPQIEYEVAKYHEQLICSKQPVTRCILINKARELCQKNSLKRSEFWPKRKWFATFLQRCWDIRSKKLPGSESFVNCECSNGVESNKNRQKLRTLIRLERDKEQKRCSKEKSAQLQSSANTNDTEETDIGISGKTPLVNQFSTPPPSTSDEIGDTAFEIGAKIPSLFNLFATPNPQKHCSSSIEITPPPETNCTRPMHRQKRQRSPSLENERKRKYYDEFLKYSFNEPSLFSSHTPVRVQSNIQFLSSPSHWSTSDDNHNNNSEDYDGLFSVSQIFFS